VRADGNNGDEEELSIHSNGGRECERAPNSRRRSPEISECAGRAGSEACIEQGNEMGIYRLT
jgi:hypothetical protein